MESHADQGAAAAVQQQHGWTQPNGYGIPAADMQQYVDVDWDYGGHESLGLDGIWDDLMDAVPLSMHSGDGKSGWLPRGLR